MAQPAAFDADQHFAALRLRRVDDGFAQRRIEFDQRLATHQRHGIFSSGISRAFGFCASYIGQFTGHGNKAGDRDRFGAPGRIDLGGCGQPGRIDRQRFEALPQHFPALAEGGGRHLFEGAAVARLRCCARHQPHHRGGDLGLRHEGGRRNVEQDFGLGAPVGEHREPAIGLVILARDDPLGDLALKHQHHHVVPGRPRLDREPVDQQSGGDVVGQVGDDFCAFAAEHRARIEALRVGVHDLQPAGITLRNIVERRQRALVALDRDDALGAQRQQRARQSAGAGADLDHGGALQRARGACDPRGEVEVEQEILAERFACRQGVFANDVAQRRQIVDRAHEGLVAAMRAASRNAATRLDGLALPVPAMSKAVP